MPATKDGRTQVKAQKGPQTGFLASSVDIAIFGGSAGSGKSYSLLLECLRHVSNPGFSAVVFRRTYPELMAQGGLWSTSENLYPQAGGEPRVGLCDWTFPSGAIIAFSHMQHVKDKLRWFGSQIPLLGFDEGQTFEEEQFWFMLSRNRTTCGVRPYVRMTCNPDADSWLAKFLEWWIDPVSGYAIPARAGKARWFVREADKLEWADDPAELMARFPNSRPKSVAFFPAKLADNPALMRADPGYLANLMALPLVERERLLGGNWKIRPAAGLVYTREALAKALVDAIPADADTRIRYWDKAAIDGGGDHTAGVLVAKAGPLYHVEDVVRVQYAPAARDALMRAVADADKKKYPFKPPEQVVEQEPGSSGVDAVQFWYRLMQGHTCRAVRPTGDKVTRAGPAASQLGAGNIKILKASWTDSFVSELAQFPDGKYDDMADGFSGAMNELMNRVVAWLPPPPLNLNKPGAQTANQRWGLYGLR